MSKEKEYDYSPELLKEMSEVSYEDDKYDFVTVNCKGHMKFCIDKYGVISATKFDSDKQPHMINSFINYDLIKGLEFLESVRDGGFINYDGSIADIIVDGYVSELGLNCEGICQGYFLVTGDLFEGICKNHEVYVNWANK